MKVRQENEERKKLIVHAPLPRREGVSGPTQNSAGIGLGADVPMLAPSLSLPMIAAVTARTRNLRKGRDHIQLGHSSRHNDHATPREQAPRVHLPGSQPAAGDRLAPLADLALARHRRFYADPERSRRVAYYVDCISQLDRQALVASTRRRTQDGAQTSDRRAHGAVALHPLEGGKLDRRGGSVLRRLANDRRLVRRSKAPRLERSAGSADGRSGASVSRLRLLDRMAGRTVAEYLAAMPRAGSLRFW